MKYTISLFAILLSISISFSQNCPADSLHNSLLNQNNQYRNSYLKHAEFMYSQLIGGQIQNYSSTQITIPVVFHIMHIGESVAPNTTVTDEVINDVINRLNDDFKGLREPGMDLANNTPAGIDTEIDFCLANVGPDGLATNGINRIDASIISGYVIHGITGDGPSSDKVMDLSAWPVHKYLNIWVFHNINLAPGFASRPNGDKYDGIAIEASSLNSTTITHEVGHWLDLYHTFHQHYKERPCQNDDCLIQGDKVCDTPPANSDDICNFTVCVDTPESYINMANFMSYCTGNNRTRFTLGQKERMQLALNGPIRGELLKSIGCQGNSTAIKKNASQISNFEINPNPATDILNVSINMERSISYQFEIVDLQGRYIWNKKGYGRDSLHSINLQSFTPGTYYCVFKCNSFVEVKKLVILK